MKTTLLLMVMILALTVATSCTGKRLIAQAPVEQAPLAPPGEDCDDGG